MPSAYHETRFDHDPRRELLWKTLCDAYFNKLIRPDFHVLELGAGYAYFINNVRCARRTAVDRWEKLPSCVAPGVEAKVGEVTDLRFVPDGQVDFAFASNLFEHLTQAEFASVLAQLKQKLRPGGTLTILQPNYKLAYRHYFDDYTHVAVYSDISLCDFLRANGYRVISSAARFLPFSLKSRFPVAPWLIRMYLMFPWKPFAGQMLVRAMPDRG
ncbi:MAG TPA: class I SAM-dependent methyltransferase [Bryobacteraceae bacterium]|nr:class I SAM-dependent methyltransferase [Bryobacteraceae bacterium]